MNDLIKVFAVGLLSSAHCIGMCGGFAAAIGATNQPLGLVFLRQIIYSVGRVFTYAFLGAVAGYAGLRLSGYKTPLVTVQQAFSILAGVIMVGIGVSVLGLFRLPVLSRLDLGPLLAPMFQHFLNARSRGGFFVAGLANGFLPCGLVYAFLADSVATGDVFRGAMLMTAFGLGTVPVMVATGCGAGLVSHAVRHRVYQLAAILVILIGGVTIYRAVELASGQPCHDPAAISTTR